MSSYHAIYADDGHAHAEQMPLRDLWECVYCGRTHHSESGTGCDVVCCGEIGRVQPVNYEDDDAIF